MPSRSTASAHRSPLDFGGPRPGIPARARDAGAALALPVAPVLAGAAAQGGRGRPAEPARPRALTGGAAGLVLLGRLRPARPLEPSLAPRRSRAPESRHAEAVNTAKLPEARPGVRFRRRTRPRPGRTGG